MRKSNLLEVTKGSLAAHHKTLTDIKAVLVDGVRISIEHFESLAASTEYDPGWGCQEIKGSLKLVGDDFWFERAEYDGSEWWEFKQLPSIPEEFSTVKTLLTFDPSENDEEEEESPKQSISEPIIQWKTSRIVCSNDLFGEVINEDSI